MTEEARLEATPQGKVPVSEGWFVVNAAEATWIRSDRFGAGCRFETRERQFDQLGFNVRVLEPGQPACLYHREENAQECFLVLSGKCLLVVEDQERELEAGDFFHCPPGTNHVLVGAGSGPSTVVMAGIRPEDPGICYPVSEVAARYGASVESETRDPGEAYGEWDLQPCESLWPER